MITDNGLEIAGLKEEVIRGRLLQIKAAQLLKSHYCKASIEGV
jgi:hypothetical protein